MHTTHTLVTPAGAVHAYVPGVEYNTPAGKVNANVALLVYAVLLKLSLAKNCNTNDPPFDVFVEGVMVKTLLFCDIDAVLPRLPETIW